MKDWINKRVFLMGAFVVVFIVALIKQIPSNMLGRIIGHYSKGYLQLYNPHGTFWQGEGLLAVANSKTDELSPLLLVNWDVKLGLKKFLSIDFSVDKSMVAEFYIDKTGANLDNLDVLLSITQVSQLVEIVNSLGLSGSLEIMAKHINVGKKIDGVLNISINQVSSSISPVNPLGTYQMQFTLQTGEINITSDPNSNMAISGNGSLQGLTLSCKILPSKKDKMLEFVTVMGIPRPDGSYAMKIF
jgi:hypothetical protein